MSENASRISVGGTRKFAAHKVDRSASEMRAAAAISASAGMARRGSLSSAPSTPMMESASSLDTPGTPDASTPTVVAPVIEYLRVDDTDAAFQKRKANVESDKCKDLLTTPADDIEYIAQKREYRTLRTSLPDKQAQQPMLPAYMQDAFDLFQSNWYVMRRKYEPLSRYPQAQSRQGEEERKKLIESLPHHKFEVDAAEDESGSGGNARNVDIKSMFTGEGGAAPAKGNELLRTEADPVVIKYLDDKTPAEGQSGGRSNDLFRFFREIDSLDHSDSSEERPVGEPFGERLGRRFLFQVEELSIGARDNEPFFGVVALYDIGQKKKISENFHFDTNSADTMSLLGHVTRAAVTLSRQAIFQIHECNPDIYLVVRIEKVLEGDEGPIYDRIAAGKPKATSEVKEYCSRLGRFRQPIAWAGVPIFNGDCEVETALADETGTMNLRAMFRHEDKISDEEVINNLIAFQNPKRTSKVKPLGNAILKFKLREITDDEEPIPNCVTPSYIPVKPFERDIKDKELEVVEVLKALTREVEEFPQHPLVVPHTDYVNTLYVYPQSVNLSKWTGSIDNARNISIRVQLMQPSEDGRGLAPAGSIFGRSSSASYVTEINVPVSFHNKTPQFYEEIKIAIPVKLTPAHHVLFTFLHVSCKPKKGKADETVLGYAWMPLLDGNRIIANREYQLPIATERDASSHEPPAAANKWVDGKRPLFAVRTRLNSSVFSQDEKIGNYFAALEDIGRPGSEEALVKAMQELEDAEPAAVVQFSIILLDQLFGTLVRVGATDKDDVNLAAFKAILFVVSTVHSETHQAGVRRNAYLVSYVRYRYSNRALSKKSVFEEIVRFWLQLVTNKDTPNETVKELHRFSWFFFDVISKSIWQHLKAADPAWRPGATPETKLFKASFLKNIQQLASALSAEVVNNKVLTGKELNESLAYFFTDAFTFFDRKTVLAMIQAHVASIKYDAIDALVALKFDFLRIVSGYEHYVALNLPTQDIVDKPFERVSNIQQEFWARYYLVGLLLYEVGLSLDYHPRTTRIRALIMLKDLLGKLDNDPRINTLSKRNRVAAMFFPVIPMVIKRLPKIMEDPQEKRSAGLSVVTPATNAPANDDTAYTSAERRLIFICFLQVLNNLDVKYLYEWLKKADMPTFYAFLEVLGHCVDTFAYPGRREVDRRRATMSKPSGTSAANDAKQRLEQFYQQHSATGTRRGVGAGGAGGTLGSGGTMGDRKSASLKAGGSIKRDSGVLSASSPLSVSSSSASESSGTYGRSGGTFSSTSGMASLDGASEARLSGCLATEVSCAILHVFEIILSHQRPQQHESMPARKMFDLLVRFLEKNQSERVVLQLFTILKTFIHKYPPAIFKDGTPYCAEMCRLLLRYAASPLNAVRQHAAAMIYLLMKKNYEATNGNGFLKVRTQSTVALSKLSLDSDAHIRRAFATLIEYSSSDTSLSKTPFPAQVKDAAERMFMIVRDSIKRLENDDDPDMVVDMLYRVAMSQLDSPDLRLATLENICKSHLREQNYQEAAFCYIHMAALIAECMNNMQRKGIIKPVAAMPAGAAAFKSLSENVIIEERITTEGEGIGEPGTFCEEEFIKQLQRSLNHLEKENLFETINEVSKMLLPLYEKKRDWQLIATTHFDLYKAFEKLKNMNASGKRVFSSYFRVAFFGARFGELNGQQFIYKERRIARLADVCTRMEAYYVQRFGAENFELLTDSKEVDPSKLDPTKGYIQITSVEPYFTEEEIENRPTMYDRMNNIRRFMYETPFTLSGKAHGSTAEQHMRKTIVTTEFCFPFIKRRMPIVKREVIELNPIEVSIESIAKRNDALAAALNQNPRDAKALQVLLQGSVRLQVNAGPLEIANTFLAPAAAGKYPADQIAKLRVLFAHFLQKCQEALYANRSLVKDDQRAYQEDLEEGYRELKQNLSQYLDADALEEARKAGMSEDRYKSILDLISGVEFAQHI